MGKSWFEKKVGGLVNYLAPVIEKMVYDPTHEWFTSWSRKHLGFVGIPKSLCVLVSPFLKHYPF